jgi:ribosomal 50S subunit-recycling heat shock protein
METNDSKIGQKGADLKIPEKRHSNRQRKPIDTFIPEGTSAKPKKPEFNVTCEVTQTKGLKLKNKIVNFEIAENAPARKIVRSFLKKIKFISKKSIILYFCEETQSKIYSEWQKFKASDVLCIGSTCKIRVYTRKIFNGKIEKQEKSKLPSEDKQKVEQKNENLIKSHEMFQYSMFMMNYIQHMMMQAMINQQTYQFPR